MGELDHRVHAYRADLADLRLKGKVRADRFTPGETARIVSPVTGLRRHPAADAIQDSEAVMGESVTVFDDNDEGWSWVQLARDDYVGWMAGNDLSKAASPPTHIVCVPRTLVFSGPDIKSPLLHVLPLGAAVAIVSSAQDHNAHYGLLERGGAVVTQHLLPVDQPVSDFVAVAESLAGTPYLWGGCSAFGLDCSGLLQTAMRVAGQDVPRDSDMQERAIGTELDMASGLPPMQRGDLVFWKGHVGIMRDGQALLHANAHHMAVAAEPLSAAIARFEAAGYPVTSVRRP